jgi:adenosylmethionine-8-amino-7-oxononanoate aminotransferase
MACAAALAVQRVLKRDRLVERCAAQGEKLAARLRQAFAGHPHVGDVRGRGLFRAIEFVADRGTKAPFDPERKIAARIRAEAMATGLLCYPMGGTIDGRLGDHVLLAPPFIIDDDELDQLVDRLRLAIDRAIAA